ncbi:unnamed protein product [Polarella glacialis]|uniref:Uncharacterized protein n=1 Tax=Polarella glacialis TaxID=89957 RepID=A0A813H5F5_POLGL|nr:unnamed protein product [Polarella glacialis]
MVPAPAFQLLQPSAQPRVIGHHSRTASASLQVPEPAPGLLLASERVGAVCAAAALAQGVASLRRVARRGRRQGAGRWRASRQASRVEEQAGQKETPWLEILGAVAVALLDIFKAPPEESTGTDAPGLREIGQAPKVALGACEVVDIRSGEKLAAASLLQPAVQGQPAGTFFLTHWGDFNSWEVAQQIRVAVQAGRVEGAAVCLVGVGSVEAGRKFAQMLEVPADVRIYADPSAACHALQPRRPAPDRLLLEPWRATAQEQGQFGCVLGVDLSGVDYPQPIFTDKRSEANLKLMEAAYLAAPPAFLARVPANALKEYQAPSPDFAQKMQQRCRDAAKSLGGGSGAGALRRLRCDDLGMPRLSPEQAAEWRKACQSQRLLSPVSVQPASFQPPERQQPQQHQQPQQRQQPQQPQQQQPQQQEPSEPAALKAPCDQQQQKKAPVRRWKAREPVGEENKQGFYR